MDKLLKFSDFFEFQLKCFKILGLAPLDDEATLKRRTMRLLKIYHYFLIASLVSFMMTTVVFIKNNISDLNLVSEVIQGTGMGFIAFVKLISISANKKEFTELINTLERLFPKTQKDQEKFKAHGHFCWFNRLRNVFKSLFLFSGMLLSLSPFIQLVITGNWFGRLPIPSWYPFDEFDPRVYNFILLWQWGYIFTLHVSTLALDMILCAFVTLISMHFDNLSNRLQDLQDIDLRELIKLHIVLMELTDKLERIFSVPALFNFFEGSILICLFGYQIIIISSFENTVKNCVFLVTILSHIFMLCYYGSKLVTSSGKVAQSAYDSAWHGKELRKGKNLMLMIQRAQKPSILTAYKFSIVSLDAYFNVSF